MKVLIIHNYHRDRGGEARALEEQREALESKGHEVCLYTRDNWEISDSRIKQFRELGINMFFSVKTYKEVLNLVQNFCPDVVHIHNIFPLLSPSVYYAVKKFNIPLVQTLHNYRMGCPNGLFLDSQGEVCEKCLSGNFFHAVWRKCVHGRLTQSLALSLCLSIHRMAQTFDKADVFLCPSHFLAQKMIRAGIPKKKIRVKPHFIDTQMLCPSHTYEPYAVYMGRLSREKGIYTLLRVFKKRKDIGLKIIGKGPLLSEVKSFILKNNLSHIECLGYIPSEERFEKVRKAAFMVFPCLCRENFPYVLIESLALGVPVIASHTGGVSEIIEDSQNGFLFSPGSEKEINVHMESLLNDPLLLQRMRKKARKKAERCFSRNKGYQELLNIYTTLVRGFG